VNYRPHSLLALVVSGVGLNCPAATDISAVPFRDIDFEAACKAATTEHKIVFVDFYTTWCGPCKELDKTTWRDANVVALLSIKTVPLKIDAEKEPTLAKRYGVTAYPTLLLVNADGTEIDRFADYLPPERFTAEFNASITGTRAITRLRERAEAAWRQHATDADDRALELMESADQLAQAGRNQEALQQLLWLFDDRMKGAPSFELTRTTSVTGYLGNLIRNYPPARAAVFERRDTAKAQLLADPTAVGSAWELDGLNRALDDVPASMAMFDRLPQTDRRRNVLGERLFYDFVKARRYNDALAGRPYTQMKRAIEAQLRQRGPSTAPSELWERNLRASTIYVESLAGAGDLPHALELATEILGADSSTVIKVALREHMERAGHPELENAQ
jgi:thioredoxin 1